MGPETAKALRDRTLKAFDNGEDEFDFDFNGSVRTVLARYAYYLCQHMHVNKGWDCDPGPRPWAP
jgi:hypothetical protein